MATSAFKSTTKRTPMATPSNSEESASSSKAHRRSRSLSRFSRRLPELEPDVGEVPTPRGKFVNTVRGSGFPEISLDDLANEFFPLKDNVDDKEGHRSRSSRRSSEISPSTASSQRRGRSVSRHNYRASDGKGSHYDDSAANGRGARAVTDANSRRRRSVSVVRHPISDSESQSSAVTDEESRDARYVKKDIEKTIRAVYAQKKAEHPTGDDVNHGLYDAMRKELRSAVDEIRTELEQAMARKPSALASDNCLQSDNSDVFQAVSAVRKNYATKLEQSEKRKQVLLAEMAIEEQRGKELSKIVRELVPDSHSSDVAQKASQARKKSNDRCRMSKRLNEEAERYFEDFISNVEDTDFSSFDGEKSDTSSTLGGITKPRDGIVHGGETQNYHSPAQCNSLPVEMDGVILPWLKWETTNDGSPLSSKNKKQLTPTPKTLLWDAAQDVTLIQDPSSHSTSSRGSWSPKLLDDHSIYTGENNGSKSGEVRNYKSSQFDMDEYRKLRNSEELLFESWRERHRISSGGLLLCSNHL